MSTSTTAVASKSRPESAAGVISSVRNGFEQEPRQGLRGNGIGALPDTCNLALQVGHVALVQRNLLLVGLEAIQHPLIVELAAEPDAFLFRQILLRLGQQL